MSTTITKSANYNLSTVGASQDGVSFKVFRDMLMGIREDSNINIIDRELYTAYKRGVYILKNDTYSAGVYGINNTSVKELHEGMVVILMCTADNTGSSYLDILNTGGGEVPVKKTSSGGLVNLDAGDLKANTPTILTFDAVNRCFMLVANPVKTASTTQAGIAMLSSALNSDSETVAATSKAVKTLNDTVVKQADKGIANGVAQLGSDAKLAESQIPASLAGSAKLIGLHDASGGGFPSNPKEGNIWKVSAAGVLNSQKVNIGDYMLYSGGGWHFISSFHNAAQTKLEGISAGAEVNVQSDWLESDPESDAFIKNKPITTTQINIWS